MPIVALGKLLQRAGSSHRSCNRTTLMVAQEQAGHYCQHLHTIENATSIIYYRYVLATGINTYAHVCIEISRNRGQALHIFFYLLQWT